MGSLHGWKNTLWLRLLSLLLGNVADSSFFLCLSSVKCLTIFISEAYSWYTFSYFPPFFFVVSCETIGLT